MQITFCVSASACARPQARKRSVDRRTISTSSLSPQKIETAAGLLASAVVGADAELRSVQIMSWQLLPRLRQGSSCLSYYVCSSQHMRYLLEAQYCAAGALQGGLASTHKRDLSISSSPLKAANSQNGGRNQRSPIFHSTCSGPSNFLRICIETCNACVAHSLT